MIWLKILAGIVIVVWIYAIVMEAWDRDRRNRGRPRFPNDFTP